MHKAYQNSIVSKKILEKQPEKKINALFLNKIIIQS